LKEKVLNKLKESAPGFISGEVLSETFGVSRTSIWKYINDLKKEGYEIESSSRKGYRLDSIPDIMNGYEIKYGLDTKIIGRDIHYFDTLDSTNTYAKKLAYEGCPEGTVVVADCQTAGRGRLGRAWDSREHKGIWMSIVLRPCIAPEDIQVITLAASVAVAGGIEKVTGIQPGIKWPNDIILDGRKVCGILTEMNSEVEQVNFIVLGIGINVNQHVDDFSGELIDKATSLSIYARTRGEGGVPSFTRAEIAKSVLTELEKVYGFVRNGNIEGIINRWKELSVTLGREVKAIARNIEYTGMAVDLTEDGKLIILCRDGARREVVSGEISVRGIMGQRGMGAHPQEE
jgi:BirA family biotin operon repressor/biotin-[acetyl-CoA-carboxylase] ligase